MDLAGRTGLVVRYIEERLAVRTCRRPVEYHRSGQMFTLPDEHAAVWATRTVRPSGRGCSLCSCPCTRPEDGLINALRVGRGVGWDEHSDSPYRGTVRLPGLALRGRVPGYRDVSSGGDMREFRADSPA